MFLYFEDWSHMKSFLDQRKISHGGRIIKIFASPVDPRISLDKPLLKVVEVDDSPINGEVYEYEERGRFFGEDIEERVKDLNDYVKRSIRALVRFSNREDLLFCQTGMRMKNADGSWLIDHPIEEIDSIDYARNYPTERSTTVHLDIFNSDSLKRLSDILNIDPKSPELLEIREGRSFKRRLQDEINFAGLGERRK